MNREFVAARYQENMTQTLRMIPEGVRLTIYNKGGKFGLPDKARNRAEKVIPLRNVGREGHTYLHHIVENYDNLADLTIFSQADMNTHVRGPEAHSYFTCPDASKPWAYMRLESVENSTRHTQWSPARAKLPDHITNAILQYGARRSDTPFSEWWSKFIKLDPPTPRTAQFSWGGIFSVTRPYIHQYSKGYYKKILKTLSQHPNPEEGHFMERAWSYIFKPIK